MKNITYEQPLHERVRTFLRLEFLFKKAIHSLYGESPWDSRATIASLLDILNIASRSDLKTEIIKELERLTVYLTSLENSPDVDRLKLKRLLDDMDILVDQFHASQGQLGQRLHQNELLNSIKQRSSISGGTCDFDLPSFHCWLNLPAEKRVADLQQWFSEIQNIRASIELILRLIRTSATATNAIAVDGFYQQSLDANLPYQLIRVTLAGDSPFYSEISGGKHRFTIRFMEMNIGKRPTQKTQDVSFMLTCCVI